MTDDLNVFARVRNTMTVMEEEAFSPPRVHHGDTPSDMTIVVSSEDDWLANLSNAVEKTLCFGDRRPVVHQIPQDHEVQRLVIGEEAHQSPLKRVHPPKGSKPASRPLTQFVTKMQVRNR